LDRLASDYVDQVKKKAMLFRTGRVVLIPLGEDFKYDSADEMNQMLTSYERIFDFINSNKNRFGINIRFGTLSDYFHVVETTVKKRTFKPKFRIDFQENIFFLNLLLPARNLNLIIVSRSLR